MKATPKKYLLTKLPMLASLPVLIGKELTPNLTLTNEKKLYIYPNTAAVIGFSFWQCLQWASSNQSPS
jgi:hypothetical protein